jgi:hypothetical protein
MPDIEMSLWFTMKFGQMSLSAGYVITLNEEESRNDGI